jgi:hypothetical protein
LEEKNRINKIILILMKNLEILEAFELEINKLDDYANKPKTDDS